MIGCLTRELWKAMIPGSRHIRTLRQRGVMLFSLCTSQLGLPAHFTYLVLLLPVLGKVVVAASRLFSSGPDISEKPFQQRDFDFPFPNVVLVSKLSCGDPSSQHGLTSFLGFTEM